MRSKAACIVICLSAPAWAQLAHELGPPANTAERKLELAKEWVEVVGACLIDPNSDPSCWDMQGRPNSQLAKNVRNAMRAAPGNYTNLRIVPGKKNRLAVYREHRSWSGSGGIMSVGGGWSSLWLHREEWPAQSGSRYQIETRAVMIAAPVGAKTGELPVVAMENVPNVETPLVEGRSAKLITGTLTVASFGPAPKGAPRIDGSEAVSVLRLLGSAMRYEVQTARLKGSDGKILGANPSAANRVYVPQPRLKVIPTKEGFDVWLNVEPKRIRSIVFGGQRRKPYAVTGIPLDPSER